MSSRTPLMRWVVLCVALGFVMAGTAHAQSGSGTISGLVKDESGASVPGVTVTVTNTGTNAVTEVTTNRDGLYSVQNLPIGTYSVSFSLTAFTPYTRDGIQIGLAEAVDLDHTLTVGTLQDAVTVTGDTALMNTSNAEVGTAMTSDIVTDLPLSVSGGRSLENFAYAITPSVEGNNWTSNINGSAPFMKEVVLDGTSAVIQIGGHIGESSPPMEAVEEFTVQTSGIPAEYGRTGGGLFNFSLKSGTNRFRGSAYGFIKNEALNANTWQNNYLAGIDPDNASEYERADDRQYVMGASLGGPIIKDKTFFFLAVEEYRQSRFLLGGLSQTVPTQPMLNGDFSQLLQTGAAPLGTDTAGNPIYPGAIVDPTNGQVFPGNIIPQDRISSTSQQILDIYQQSYLPQVDRLSQNSALPYYNSPDFKQHQISAKLNHRFSNSSVLTGSFIWTQRPRTLVDQGGIWDPNDPEKDGGPFARARLQDVGSRQFRMSHSWTVSPNIINVANFTYSTYNNPSTSLQADGGWPQTLGFGDTGVGNFPQVSFGSAVNGIGITQIGYGANSGYKGKTWILSDSLSWVTGKHMFKFGGEFRSMGIDSTTSTGVLNFNFSPDTTGVPGQSWSNQVGFGFASMLLGGVASADQETDGDLFGGRNYLSFYAQDDWRATDNLTLNLGLRWETTGPWSEKNGHWATFDTETINPVTGIPGAMVYANSGDTTFEGPRDFSQFGPRIGLTYTPSPRFVVRAAYGIFYQPIGADYWAGVPYNFAPGFRATNRVDTIGQGRPVFNWDNGYPGAEVPAGDQDPNYMQWGPVTINDESLSSGRIQQWNAGFEYEVTNDLVLGLNYIGTKSTGMNSGELERGQPDMAGATRITQAGTEWNWVDSPESAAAAGVPYPYPGFTGTAWMALNPYPTVTQAWAQPQLFVGSPFGAADYTAFQATLVKRMSNGFAANVSYTWSKSHGNQSTGFQETWGSGPIQDVNRLDFEANVIGFNDRTHIFKGYAAWELPFGQGRKWMNQGGILDALFGGWQLSFIFRYETGLPLGISSNNWYQAWGFPIYVNADPNGNYDRMFSGSYDAGNATAPGNQYFNGDNYSNPAYGEFGEGPGRFEQQRGFGFSGEDFGLLKNFTFGDSYRLQVRLELINAFNRHYYSNPVTNIGSENFGYVISTTGQPRQGQIGIRFEF